MTHFSETAFGSGTTTTATLLHQDIIISLEDVQYFLVQLSKDLLGKTKIWHESIVPAVAIIVSTGDRITEDLLKKFRIDRLDKDDIFQPEFLENIIFYGGRGDNIELDSDALNLLRSWKTVNISFVSGNTLSQQVAPGPYIIYNGQLWQPWRIYEDYAETLMLSFRPPDLNARKSKERPLDGIRIVVKDSFDIAGFPTSLCNRAWRELYPTPEKAAPCVEKLVRLGAILVGKAKLQAMIVREDTMECVDFLAPFNPRGDGYQNASGSSNGSCAAIGTYEWLDFAIGSDTNASGRKPGQYNGCFAIRPTHGVLDDRGLMAKILYPLDYLPTSNKAQMRIIDGFVENLESVLGVSKTELRLKDVWAKAPPDGADKDMSEYLEKV
ncbi:hypothetical protein MMC30_005624 [Trapelia coarctata]|nr:hypothetical protein [Trapelia coarctata]